MNDLERDLATLFRERADDIDTPTLAPGDVVRRARRRQIGTIVGGSVLLISAILALIVAVATVRPAPDSLPAVPSAPSRTATIHGITVTAPAGWTLIDDWPIAASLAASSETCSFTGTATAIPPSAETIAATAGPSAESSGSCTTQPTPLPAGAPVVQLANFSLPLDGSLCTAGPLRSAEVPADGVAMYVAALDGLKTADVLDACPGSRSLTTFADRSVQQLYVAVSIVGPDAADDDVATIDREMNNLGGIRIPDSDSVAATSPGYVVAAGVDGGVTWRIEAGFPSRGSTSGIGATQITSDAAGHETVSDPVGPVAPGAPPSETALPLMPEPSALLWGTSAPDVTAIANVAPDGTTTEATLVPWPDGMRSTTAVDERSQLDGSIWFAVVPQVGHLEVSSGGTVSSAPPPTLSGADELDWKNVEGSLVAKGTSAGEDWNVSTDGAGITVTIAGHPNRETVVPWPNTGWWLTRRLHDDPSSYDALGFVLTDLDVQRVCVVSEGNWCGRWMPARDAAGHEARLWVIELPGAGSGPPC